LEIGVLNFQTFNLILRQTCRNSRGRVFVQKKSKTWCVYFLCAAAKDKNIKKIFEKRKIAKKHRKSRKKRKKRRKQEKKSST
jgi:hypothetical protein